MLSRNMCRHWSLRTQELCTDNLDVERSVGQFNIVQYVNLSPVFQKSAQNGPFCIDIA